MRRVVVTGLGTINPLGSDVLSSSNTVSEGADNTSLSERVYRENYMTPGWLEQQEDLTKGEEDSEHINDEKGTVAATTMAMTRLTN